MNPPSNPYHAIREATAIASILLRGVQRLAQNTRRGRRALLEAPQKCRKTSLAKAIARIS
jgi:hypothetical protein